MEKYGGESHIKMAGRQYFKGRIAESIVLPALILMVHNFQEIDLAAFPVFGNIMTQCYISYVALGPLHRMQNDPWALLADHQIGVLHKGVLMCFSVSLGRITT